MSSQCLKILVTGGAGFIGSAVIRHLVNNTNHSVVNADKLTYAGNLESLESISVDARYDFEQVDICDAKELHLEIIQKAQLMGYRIKEIPAILHWRDRKRGQSTKRKLLPEIAIFKMRKTVLSHLIFNYITNPGMLLFLPIFTFLTVSFAGSVMLAGSFFDKMGGDFSLMEALRQTLLDGQLTLIVVLSSFVTLMIFIVFYFLSSQNKRYFDETYTLLMRMNARIKHLEMEQGEDK